MTRLLYLRDSITLKATASISEFTTAIIDKPKETLTFNCILDKTHFYPRGGGQPSDNGTISIDNFGTLNVNEVYLDKEKVIHKGFFSRDGHNEVIIPKPGTSIQYSVCEETRSLHNRLHSAGHILDIVLFDILKYSDELEVSKAYHYPNGANIEYKGRLDIHKFGDTEKKAFIERLQTECQKLIDNDNLVNISFDESSIDEDKATRYMSIDGFERLIPCGGTHVSNLKQIETMVIRKIEFKNGNTRIGYDVK